MQMVTAISEFSRPAPEAGRSTKRISPANQSISRHGRCGHPGLRCGRKAVLQASHEPKKTKPPRAIQVTRGTTPANS